MNKRVLVTIHAPTWGGLHAIASVLCKRMNDAGWTWVVALPEHDLNSIEKLTRAGVEVIPLQITRFRRAGNIKENWKTLLSLYSQVKMLQSVMQKNKIDVVQCMGVQHMHSAIAARSIGVPLVWQIHSDVVPRIVRWPISPIVGYWANCIMTNGKSVFSKFPGLYHYKNKWIVFYAPLDIDNHENNMLSKAEARRELQAAPEEKIIIGTIGNQTWQKGHELFVDIAKNIIQKHPNVGFRILGSPVESNKLYYDNKVRLRAENYGLFDTNRFKILHLEKNASVYLSGLDIFILTSRAEGVPVALFEAMATKLPVISTKVGSISEIIEDKKSGYLVNDFSPDAFITHIDSLLKNPESRTDMGKNGHKRIKDHFDIDSVVNAHISAYNLAINSA